MAKQYWVKHEGKTTGPFSGNQLKQMAKAGIVGQADMISLDQETWYPAPDVRGLLPAEQSAGQRGGDAANSSLADLTAYAVEPGPDSGRHITYEPTVLEILPVQGQGRSKRWLLFALALLAAAGIGWGLSIASSRPATGLPDDDAIGLGKDALQIASHTLYGTWVENDEPLEPDRESWFGSAGVYAKKDGKVYLFTNSHCLGLAKLAGADEDRQPEIQHYDLILRFASGVKKRVSRFADQDGSLDLALLEVDADGLVEDRDYVILPFDEEITLSPGDATVAVGSPHGHEGSQTFGRISSPVRPKDPLGHKCQTIQTDAPINRGNSGGPLFKEQDGRFHWIGVNTWNQGNGLGFAIHVRELRSQFFWYDCNKYGATQAIRKQYKVAAQISP